MTEAETPSNYKFHQPIYLPDDGEWALCLTDRKGFTKIMYSSTVPRRIDMAIPVDMSTLGVTEPTTSMEALLNLNRGMERHRFVLHDLHEQRRVAYYGEERITDG